MSDLNFQPDETQSLGERFAAAVAYLEVAEGISPGLLEDLRPEYEDSLGYLDGGVRTLKAVERAEALAAGQNDPAAMAMSNQEMTATDWRSFW